MYSEINPEIWEKARQLMHSDCRKKGPDWWLSPNKRLFDILFSLMVSPAVLGIIGAGSAMVYLKDGGKPFVHLKRWHPRKGFEIHKIRTMEEDSEQLEGQLGESIKILKMNGTDPRVILPQLRKTSSDESPQFINTLKGEMSVVGPRPITDYERLSEIQPNEAVYPYNQWLDFLRQGLKFGITGLTQVLMRNWSGPKVETIKLDLFMATKANFISDIRIILATLRPEVIFGGK